jgi:aconitate hydratase
LAPRYLGLQCVIARSFARIHQQNLVNFGVLPITLDNDDYCQIECGAELRISDARNQTQRPEVIVENLTEGRKFISRNTLSLRQIDVVLAGGLINWARQKSREH